jgi:hypothetical protein
VRGTPRAHEVGVIGVREPVRARLCVPHDNALLEGEHRVAGARGGERVADRLGALRVRVGVPPPLDRA